MDSLTQATQNSSPMSERPTFAAKRPRRSELSDEDQEMAFDQPLSLDEEEEEDLLPDLADFFEDFGVPLDARPAICSAYATYVRSLLKQKKKASVEK